MTVEDHSVPGGLGEAVAGLVSSARPTRVRRVGVRDVFGQSGRANELLDLYGLRARDVVREAEAILKGESLDSRGGGMRKGCGPPYAAARRPNTAARRALHVT